MIDLDDFTAVAPPAAAAPLIEAQKAPVKAGDVDANPLLKSPLVEPAEEPAPAEPAPASEEAKAAIEATLADQLRQAVLGGNSDELNNLFKKVLEPKQWKPTDASRTKAFSAFDELATSPAENLLESVSPLSDTFPAPEAVEPVGSTLASSSSSQLGAAPGPDAVAALVEALAGLPPSPGAAATAAMPSSFTVEQLQGLSPQDLLKMQSMISHALKAGGQAPQAAQANPADPFAGAGAGDVNWATQPFGDLAGFASLGARKPGS